MRVVFFVGTLEAGGLERFVTRVCREAKSRQFFEPVIVCLHQRRGIFLQGLEKAGILVHEAPRGWYRSPVSWVKLVTLLKRIDGSLVHSQVNFSLIQQFLGVRLAGMRYLVTERNCYHRSGFPLFRRRIQYHFLKAFGVQYSANSRRVAEHLSEMLNEPIQLFPVFPNGIEIDEDDAGPSIESDQHSTLTIAYVARMAGHKGHLFFLEVLERLIYIRGIQVKAVMIGDGPLREEIELTVASKKLGEFVLLTGIVTNVEDYMKDSDIVALFSDYEGMPNVVIEAMAKGKPVVATDTGNVRELLGSGAGVVLDSKDVELAVTALVALAGDPVRRVQMGRAGQLVIRQGFALSSVLEGLVQNYKKILKV